MFVNFKEFKKLLKNKLQLDMAKVKSPLRKEFAYVCFRSQEDQEKAIEILNGYKWKGKVLQAMVSESYERRFYLQQNLVVLRSRVFKIILS